MIAESWQKPIPNICRIGIEENKVCNLYIFLSYNFGLPLDLLVGIIGSSICCFPQKLEQHSSYFEKKFYRRYPKKPAACEECSKLKVFKKPIYFSL